MKLGLDITCEPGAVAPARCNSGMEFVVRYVCEAVINSTSSHIRVSVTADGSYKIKATRQNTRHLNLSVLCGQSAVSRGAIYIQPDTSRINRVRAIKAAAYLANALGYPFMVADADDEMHIVMRNYKAFCWYVKPWVHGSSSRLCGEELIQAIGYAYDIQSTNLSRAS